MAIQMAVIIGGAAWGGTELDAYQQNEKPVWTIVLSLLGVAASLYFFIRAAQNMSKDDE